MEGVLGPGAANNSKEGGNLIPTVAFGVPGTTGMAILLGAFLIVGLTPGPEMLTKHLDVTLAMVWILVISNILAASVAFLFLSQLVKLTFVRGNLLIPFLVVFVFLGAFSANNHFADIVVACVFGVLGYFMVLYGWPRAPFVLGPRAGKAGGAVPRDLARRLRHGLASTPPRPGHDRDTGGKRFLQSVQEAAGQRPSDRRPPATRRDSSVVFLAHAYSYGSKRG